MSGYATIIKSKTTSDSKESLIEIIEELSDDSLEEDEMDHSDGDEDIEMENFQRSKSLSTIYEDEFEEGITTAEIHSAPNASTSTGRKESAEKRPTDSQKKLWTIRNKRAVPDEGPVLQIEEGNSQTPTWVVRNPYAFDSNPYPEEGNENHAIEIEELNPTPPARRKCKVHNNPQPRQQCMPSTSSGFRQNGDNRRQFQPARQKPIIQNPRGVDPVFLPPPPIYQVRIRPRFSPQLDTIQARVNENFRLLLGMFMFLLFMSIALFGFVVFLFLNGILRK